MSDRNSVVIVAIGPWDWAHLTLLAQERLSERVPIFSAFSAEYHPVIQRLTQEGRVVSLFPCYENEEIPHRQKYELFAEIVARGARQFGRVLWLVPGNAFVFDAISGMICARCEQEGIDVEVVPGLSSIEAIFCELRIDPFARGLQMLNAYLLREDTQINAALPSLLLQIVWPNIDLISAAIARHFPPQHEVTIAQGAGCAGGGEQVRTSVEALASTLHGLEGAGVNAALLSLYLPAVEAASPATQRRLRLFQRTRDQVVEKPLIEGGLMLIPLRPFTTARDLADVQVILDQPEYLALWKLLEQPRSLAQLTEALGGLVHGEEHVGHMLTRLFDHSLVDRL